MKTNFNSDRHLLEGCLSGNLEAGESFVREFSDRVYRTIQYTLSVKHVRFSRNDLEDLHNTVFLMLFEDNCKKLRQFRGENGCSLATWVKIVTSRIVLNHLRKKGVDSMGWQSIIVCRVQDRRTDGSLRSSAAKRRPGPPASCRQCSAFLRSKC